LQPYKDLLLEAARSTESYAMRQKILKFLESNHDTDVPAAPQGGNTDGS
jgi:hypothetical protein